MIPESVSEAVLRARQESPPLTARLSDRVPGEIGIATPPSSGRPRRIVLVLGVDESTRTLDIALTTNEADMASDLDLIVHASSSALPFPLVVEAELYGPIFEEQLRAALANVPEGAVRAIGRSLETDGESLDGFEVGLPLGGPDDPRRAFRSLELQELDAIVGECRAWLAGEDAQLSILDPMLLIPPSSGTARPVAEAQYLDLLDALANARGRDLVFPSELVSLMGEHGLIDEITRWRTDFGLDAACVLGRFRFTETAGTLPTAREDEVLIDFLSFAARAGMSSVDVVTTSKYWRHQDRLLIVEDEGCACRARALLEEAA